MCGLLFVGCIAAILGPLGPPCIGVGCVRFGAGVQMRFCSATFCTMSIVVFYMHNPQPDGEPAQWQPQCVAYSDAQMGEALAQCQSLRGNPRNAHVAISSELRDMVGKVGVAAVENGQTPDGEAYDWSKAGRAGKSRKNAQEPPKTRGQMDN